MTKPGRSAAAGLTLIEVLLGVLTLVIALTAILGAYLGQITLNEHARNLSLAVHDANRVIERIRRSNSNLDCATTPPRATPPVGTSWDLWLENTTANGGQGKSPNITEEIAVTCQDRDGNNYCGRGGGANAQVAQEWASVPGTTTHNPLRITVSVCWRHRGRTIGECTWNGAALTPSDAVAISNDTLNVIDSPVMLTTLVTCRG